MTTTTDTAAATITRDELSALLGADVALQNLDGCATKDGALHCPVNPTTGRTYSGKNVAELLVAQDEAGYPTAQWAGYGQWKAAGRQVRKGEKSTTLRRVVKVTDKKTKAEKTVVKTLRVFNIAQTDKAAKPAKAAA